MVLLAGMGIPENRRMSRSRILRAPHVACSRFTFQDVVLDLERQLVRIVMRAPASIRQPLHPTLLLTIKDLVARLAGNPKLPAQIRLSSITEHSFHGIHFLPRKRKQCNLCVRYVLGPGPGKLSNL